MLAYLTHLLRRLNNIRTRSVLSGGKGTLPAGAQDDDARQEAMELMRLADDGCPNMDAMSNLP